MQDRRDPDFKSCCCIYTLGIIERIRRHFAYETSHRSMYQQTMAIKTSTLDSWPLTHPSLESLMVMILARAMN